MEKLSVQDLRVLQYIHDNPNIKSGLLAEKLEISIRKCQKDVVEINRKLTGLNAKITIDINRTQGYSIIADSHESIELFFNELNPYLDQLLIYDSYKNEKTIEILRYILLKHDTLKIENIADQLAMSVSSIHGYLRDVRKILENYDISLKSVPYYGYQINSSAMKRISALLDYCDIPINYETTNIIEPNCLKEYKISQDQLDFYKIKLSQILKKYDYKITENGYRRVVILCCLIENNLIDFSDFVIVYKAKEYREFEMAKILDFEDEEVISVAYMLIAYQENVNIFDYNMHNFLIDSTDILYETMRIALQEETGINIGNKTQFPELYIFVYRYLSHKMFHILELNTSITLISKLSTLPASQSIAYEILRILGVRMYESYLDHLAYELILIIYNQAYSKRSEYYDIRCLVLNDFGKYSIASLINRLNLNDFGIVFDYYHSYELYDVDFNYWDFVISTSILGKPKTCTIPFFQMDYLSDFQEARVIWKDIISRRRRSVDFIENLDEADQLKVDETEATIASRLFQIVVSYGLTDSKHFQTIHSYMNHQHVRFYDNRITICLFSNKLKFSKRMVVKNSKFLRIFNQQIDTFEIILMNTLNDILAIKQIDSVFR